MRASQVSESIIVARDIGKPLMIWGPPGVGKSDVVHQSAAQLGIALLDYRAAYRDAVDIMGLPGTKDGRTFYNLPAGLPDAGEGILFLDEIVSAPPQVQAVLYQLILDRRVGDYVLPAGYSIVAAGNRASDRGVVHRMPDPLMNRFIHVDFEVHLGDWTKWAIGAGLLPETIAFMRFREALLFNHDTARKCHAFGTPRSWATCDKIVARKLTGGLESELVRGTVGDAEAGEYLAFLALWRGMKTSPDQIILNPTKAEVPDNAAILYALVEALARRADNKNFSAVMAYAERMPAEYAQCLVASATARDATLCNTAEFIRWAAAHQ